MATMNAPAVLRCCTGLWRNGSACDSRSQGWEFESLWPHSYCVCLRHPIHESQHRWVVHINQEWVVVAIGMFVAGAWPLAWRRCTSDRGIVVRSAMDRKCTSLLSSVQPLACGAMAQRQRVRLQITRLGVRISLASCVHSNCCGSGMAKLRRVRIELTTLGL